MNLSKLKENMIYIMVKLGAMLAMALAVMAFVAGDEIQAVCFILWEILLQLNAMEEKQK